MSVLKFKDTFMKMSAKKREIIREYCRLYEDSSLGVDVLFERVSHIWDRAVGHSDLLTCLQLADYIYADSDDDVMNDNKRVYLCEHLVDEVGLNSEKLDLGNIVSPSDFFDDSKVEDLELLADQVENMQDELNSRWNTLQNCVKKLREVDQSLFQNFYTNQMTAQQIADKVGRSIFAIRKSIHKIRKKLFECVDKNRKKD